ncbi:MAG: hypothetical protein ACXQS8_09440, partial [Candidatus Helarchaeales archaeon]
MNLDSNEFQHFGFIKCPGIISIVSDEDFIYIGTRSKRIEVFNKEFEKIKSIVTILGDPSQLIVDDNFLYCNSRNFIQAWDKKSWNSIAKIGRKNEEILAFAVDENHVYCGGVKEITSGEWKGMMLAMLNIWKKDSWEFKAEFDNLPLQDIEVLDVRDDYLFFGYQDRNGSIDVRDKTTTERIALLGKSHLPFKIITSSPDNKYVVGHA